MRGSRIRRRGASTEAARTPGDTDLADLYYRSGRQHFHHRVLGDLDLDHDALDIPAGPGPAIVPCPLAPTSPHR
ncbi:hypothetical protein ACH4U3_30225 [Streptomyces griseoruber]|uniref:hypothetical protein n=1 Tax=Streptomyces griseoruber TaxID=1943 RepID=UPI0037914EAE